MSQPEFTVLSMVRIQWLELYLQYPPCLCARLAGSFVLEKVYKGLRVHTWVHTCLKDRQPWDPAVALPSTESRLSIHQTWASDWAPKLCFLCLWNGKKVNTFLTGIVLRNNKAINRFQAAKCPQRSVVPLIITKRWNLCSGFERKGPSCPRREKSWLLESAWNACLEAIYPAFQIEKEITTFQ